MVIICEILVFFFVVMEAVKKIMIISIKSLKIWFEKRVIISFVSFKFFKLDFIWLVKNIRFVFSGIILYFFLI